MRKWQTGFSLVEAMVGMAIAAGIGLVLMQQQENSSKMQAKNNANQVVASAQNIVQSAISNRAVCSISLNGKKVGDQVPALIDAQVNPSNYNQFIATGKPNHVELNQVFPGNVRVEDMRIVNEYGKDYLAVSFNLNPEGRKKMFGTNIVAKKFQLQGKKNGAIYENCHSELSNLVESACTAIPGAVWDKNNNKCDLTNVIKKTDLVPIYAAPGGGLSLSPPEVKAGEVTCQKNGKKCSRTSMDCTATCPGGQLARNEREWDRCQQRVMGACVDWACMKTVDCMNQLPPIGNMIKLNP